MEASTETAVRREIAIEATPETVWEFLEQFWDERLDALKREAEIEERKKRDGSEH